MSQSIYGVGKTVSLDEHPEFCQSLETKPCNEDILLGMETMIIHPDGDESVTEERNDTSIVEWPYVQALFDKIDFRDNSALLTSRYYTDRYGNNAYAVLNEWLEGLGKETKDKIAKGISEEEGPDFDEAQYIGTFDRPGRFVI